MTAVATSPGETKRNAWWILAVLHLALNLSFIDRYAIAVLVKPITQAFDLNDFEFGILMGLPFAIFYVTCGLPFGALADRYSRRGIIMFGLAMWTLAVVGCGLAPSYIFLLLARVSVGAGEAALSPSVYSILPDIFARHRLTLATLLYSLGGAIGGSLAMVAGGWLLDSFAHGGGAGLTNTTGLAPWQLTFVTLGLCGLPVLALLCTFKEPARRAAATGNHGVLALFRIAWLDRPLYLPLLGGYGMVQMLGFVVMSWTPAYLIRTFDLSAGETGARLGSITLFAVILGQPLAGMVADWWMRRGRPDAHYLLTISAMLIGLPVVILSFLVQQEWLSWIGLALFFALIVPQGGFSFAAVQMAAPPQYRGRLSALMLMVGVLLGMGLGPVLVGFLSDHLVATGNGLGIAIAATLTTLAILASAVLLKGRASYARAVAAQEASPS